MAIPENPHTIAALQQDGDLSSLRQHKAKRFQLRLGQPAISVTSQHRHGRAKGRPFCPAIHVFDLARLKGVDARDKRGHDELVTMQVVLIPRSG
jgi:hypothetical protein